MNLPKLARESIKQFLETGKYLKPENILGIDKKFLKERAGVFVSIHLKNGKLRGCIGTFLPTKKNIAQEVIHNAVAAAIRDYRFYPVVKDELSNIEISVDVLGKPESVNSKNELDHKKYGIITKCGQKTGLLLPDIDGVNSVKHQLQICCAKANILPDEPFKIERFRVTRYHETDNQQ